MITKAKNKKIKNTAKEHVGTLGYQAETKSSNCKLKRDKYQFNGIDLIFDKIIEENYSKLGNVVPNQIQEAHKTPD